MITQFPTVTLKSGLTILNFSSPHQFKFDDDSILEACTPEHCKELSLEMLDTKEPSECGKFSFIKKEFKLTDTILNEIRALEDDHDHIDLIIVSFPILQALTKANEGSKAVTCSLDRITKICSTTEFCTL
jgi:hypothetical protein